MTPYAFLANLQREAAAEQACIWIYDHLDDLALALQQAERAERETTPTRAQVEALARYSVYLSQGTVRENPDGLMLLRSDVLALYAPVQPSAGWTESSVMTDADRAVWTERVHGVTCPHGCPAGASDCGLCEDEGIWPPVQPSAGDKEQP